MEHNTGLVAGSHNRNHLVVIRKDSQVSHNPTFNPIICQICGDDVGQFVEGGIFVACHECAYPVCRPCYDYERKEGSRACPQCKTFYKRYKGSPRIDEDDDDEDDDEERSDRGGDRGGASLDVPTTSYASYVSHNAQASSQYPMLTSNQVNPDQSVATEYNPGAMVPAGTIPPPSDYNKYERTPSRTPSQTPSANDMAMELRAPSYGYGSVVWKDRVESWKQQQGRMVVGDGNGAEEVSAGATAEGDLPSMDESRQPLSRKVHYPSSLISPYRLVIVIRLAVLVFFLRWRCLNPVDGAWWLWLISVICEVWFAFSWILDQFPKWMPIKRETYLDRLSLRFDRKGEPSQLAAVDLFVSTVDPQKEPPLTTANTLLSILSVDYPVDKVSAYVHDDGGAMLTFDAMGETAEFARRWVPFAKRYSIEPRAPEVYFTQKVDYLKDKVDQDFVKDRRQMKRDYEEFKIRINSLVARSHKMPEDGWVMQDGTPWPGSKSRDHPGMIQVFLGPSGGTDVDGNPLPRLVYVSREKRPGYNHHKKAGAMNSLIRVSAILSNAPYMLNLDCDHYLNDSKALREAMCFMMDPNVGKKCCYVQFPQRFDGIDPNDRYANHNTVFFDINLPGLDGIQGPCYVGTGCCFRRHALYGYEPPKKEKKARCGGLMCSCFSCCAGDRGKEGGGKRKKLPDGTPLPAGAEAFLGDDDVEGDSLLALKKFEKKFGQSPVFVLSTFHEEGGGVASASPGSTLKEAIHVISCGYEEKTEWGKELGWIYGSVTEDILTGFKMHARGWRSIYCKPKRATFKGGAPINLSDRLQQVLRWALGSVEIFLSRHCPIWYGWKGNRLKMLQRLSYINTVVYPFTSFPLLMYCMLPAICLLTNKFIIPYLDTVSTLYFIALFLSIFATGLLEMRWSKVSMTEWWRNEQFWVIGGVSAHLFAVFQGMLKVLAGIDTNFTVTAKQAEDGEFAELYLFKWTSLLIPPLFLIIFNVLGIVAGVAVAMNSGTAEWGDLFGKLFFAFWVIVHLYPFMKGLGGRNAKIPTIVIVWSVLLASIFSLLWVKISPFAPKSEGPSLESCGISC
ncbi:unnamed protein product [Closterium sp. NIES-64]|nr:unnamed protein product [Closterium sp. Naga37s-1]CAI5969188.1 unnamed protein product [Closterium sp. NIES-64]CAI5973004.1 unnamed protein product [Closterium sp. NIES-64]CAI6004252.1 unnamed protein product [Closterium sp. NIES-65]